jgi:hypothetical protein
MYVWMDVNDGDLICVAAVRKEIADETDRETGRSSKQISTVPIHLSIYSPSGSSVFRYHLLLPPAFLYII